MKQQSTNWRALANTYDNVITLIWLVNYVIKLKLLFPFNQQIQTISTSSILLHSGWIVVGCNVTVTLYSVISPCIYASSMSTVHIVCCILPVISSFNFSHTNPIFFMSNLHNMFGLVDQLNDPTPTSPTSIDPQDLFIVVLFYVDLDANIVGRRRFSYVPRQFLLLLCVQTRTSHRNCF